MTSRFIILTLLLQPFGYLAADSFYPEYTAAALRAAEGTLNVTP
jgi:hypothetical protein